VQGERGDRLSLHSPNETTAKQKDGRDAFPFPEPATRVVKATTETIGRYFNDRLATIFAGGRRARVPFFFKQWGGKNARAAFSTGERGTSCRG
jgi:hypothetical protein